jgi:hypothetical protein
VSSSTRLSTRRVLVIWAAAVAAAALLVIAVSWTEAPVSRDQTFVGAYTSDTDLRLASLTIQGGHVTAGYRVDVLFLPEGASSGIRCGMVDTSGRLELFEASRTTAPPGEWTRLRFEARYVLPAVTLGLRCSPNSDGALTVVFRDATLHSGPLP